MGGTGTVGERYAAQLAAEVADLDTRIGNARADRDRAQELLDGLEATRAETLALLKHTEGA
jgi:hypothetical protein